MLNLEEFRIAVPDHRLNWIAGRLRRFPWDAVVDAGGWSAGMSLSFMRELASYWLDGFDWRAQEAHLNRYPQFLAHIAGQRVHFFHVKAKGNAKGRPLLLLHGWPGSAFEFDALIEPLVTPDSSGAAFDLVIPSLPGFGFSQGLPKPISPRFVSDMMAELMQGLGYESYLVQGGDWGAVIATHLGIHAAPHCCGIHLNMVVPGLAPPESPEEKAWAQRTAQLAIAETGYSKLQMTRPQTLAFAMTDSPVGAAAWIIEKFAAWSDLQHNSAGHHDLLACYSFDQLLTNVMFYVAPDTFATATWLYHGLFRNPQDLPFSSGDRCETPTGVAAFPDPVFPPPPRSHAAKSYNVVHWTDMPRGGHFAAMEAPASLLEEIKNFSQKIESA